MPWELHPGRATQQKNPTSSWMLTCLALHLLVLNKCWHLIVSVYNLCFLSKYHEKHLCPHLSFFPLSFLVEFLEQSHVIFEDFNSSFQIAFQKSCTDTHFYNNLGFFTNSLNVLLLIPPPKLPGYGEQFFHVLLMGLTTINFILKSHSLPLS